MLLISKVHPIYKLKLEMLNQSDIILICWIFTLFIALICTPVSNETKYHFMLINGFEILISLLKIIIQNEFKLINKFVAILY
jgi:hypothetical protein